MSLSLVGMYKYYGEVVVVMDYYIVSIVKAIICIRYRNVMVHKCVRR
jgi:hypothetical protein